MSQCQICKSKDIQLTVFNGWDDGDIYNTKIDSDTPISLTDDHVHAGYWCRKCHAKVMWEITLPPYELKNQWIVGEVQAMFDWRREYIQREVMARMEGKPLDDPWFSKEFSVCDCRLCVHCTDVNKRYCDRVCNSTDPRIVGHCRADPRYGCVDWGRRE